MPPKKADAFKIKGWKAARKVNAEVKYIPARLGQTRDGKWVVLRTKTSKELRGSGWRKPLDADDPTHRVSPELENADVFPEGCNGLATGTIFYGLDPYPSSLYGVDVYVRYPN